MTARKPPRLPYRPDFVEALRLLASVSAHVEKAGFKPPILVGGGAVEVYSASAITTGDFDLVTPRQDLLEQALRAHGFTPHTRGINVTRGWIHTDLKLGFEIVGSVLLDGLADTDRVQLIDASEDEYFVVISVEDLIADRMGQFASGTAPEMLGQAKVLFSLYKDADLIYLDRRIAEETANQYGLATLQA